MGRATRMTYALELGRQSGMPFWEAIELINLRHSLGFYERRPQMGRGDAIRMMGQGFASPSVGASSSGTMSQQIPSPPLEEVYDHSNYENVEPPAELLVTFESGALEIEYPPLDPEMPALELIEPDRPTVDHVELAVPQVVDPEVNDHGGLGRAVSWRRFLEESGIFDSEPLGAEGGEGVSTPVTTMEGNEVSGPDSRRDQSVVAQEVVMSLDMPLGDTVEDTEPSSRFLADGQVLGNGEAMSTSSTPSEPEVEEWNRRMMEERRERISVWGVPRVVLILCSLFWKLELLKICDLLHGPEAPPNDDEFCRRTAESIFQNCGRSGEKLAPESRVTVHAIDVLKQTEDQIIHSIEKYVRRYTHVIMIPNAFHFWELMEQQLGGVTTVYMKEITNRYVRIGSRLMRQGLAGEVLILPFLPMGDPTCELIPRVNLAHVWNLLVDHCNQANDYIIIIATHMWTIEMAQRTMNVPNIVAWNFIPHDSRLAWEVYVSHFSDRYERRRPITLRCGQVHRSGSHYLLYELWGLVQDTAPTCECQMTVSVARPLSRRQRRKFRAVLRH